MKILITDLGMPAPGETVLRQVRPKRPDVPTIVITGHPGRNIALELEELGADRVLENRSI